MVVFALWLAWARMHHMVGRQRRHQNPPPRLLIADLSTRRVPTNSGSASQLRHFLIRYKCLQARLSGGECDVTFTPDASMLADFLTEWMHAVKLRRSLMRSLLCARGIRASPDAP